MQCPDHLAIVLFLVITHLRPGLEPFVELVHPVLRLHRVGRVSPVKRTERRRVEGVARRAGHGFCYRQHARSASTRSTWSTTIVNIHTHARPRTQGEMRLSITRALCCERRGGRRGEERRAEERRGGGREDFTREGVEERRGAHVNWWVFLYSTVWQVGQLEQNSMECNHCLLLYLKYW